MKTDTQLMHATHTFCFSMTAIEDSHDHVHDVSLTMEEERPGLNATECSTNVRRQESARELIVAGVLLPVTFNWASCLSILLRR